MNYYLVYPDRTDVRWTLEMREFDRNGERIDEWAFTRGVRYESDEPIPFFVRGEGEKVDYNPTAFSANVVSDRLAAVIEAVAPQDVQLLNATIVGEANGWKVMNFLSKVDCIDQVRSRIIYHPLDHPYRPGKPMFCDRLVIDESRAHGHHFFLLQLGSQEIVSETMRRAIEAAGITGMTYGHRPVNLP